MADLFLGHGRRAAESDTAGTGGVQSLFVPYTMSSRMNSARAAKTWKARHPPGVVVSSVSCSEVKLIPRLPGHDGDEALDEVAEPVQRWEDECVALAEVAEGLP